MENILDNSSTEISGVAVKKLAGSALQIAREAKKMSIEDAAKQIRLSVHQILALEQDNFAKLPHASITRGFIRNYARLLDIDAEPLLEAYRANNSNLDPARISLSSEHIVIKNASKNSYLRYILIGLVLLISLAAWWFYTSEYKTKVGATIDEMSANHASKPSASHEASIEPLPPQALPAAERMAEVNTPVLPPAVDTSILTMPTESVSKTPVSVNPLQAQPEIGSTVSQVNDIKPGYQTAQFKAMQTSWVQIGDMSGNVLYERTITAGVVQSFDFKPPVKVIIGNASGMQLFYKNQPVDILSSAKHNITRVTLE